ncbi:MAG: type II toxin-antitoxin system VapC family toxin [Treponema sp.]|jgi:PIN domain nuclease of toxin-antitoxin system|nr:type II toxin-antitoxin system VapC family toxin [Treponema sp.]
MKILLDTHIFLWFLDEVEKLSEPALTAILEPKNEKYISIVSAWELALKINLGKLTFEGGIAHFFTMVEENGFELLSVKEEHIKRLETLPLLHRDPFDRMLIVSALVEGMNLISSDSNIHRYNVGIIL